MKQRLMKKKIPKETVYCGDCPHRLFLGIKKLNRNNCRHTDSCDETTPCHCRLVIYRCADLKWTDHEEQSLLSEGCKEGGVSLANERQMNQEWDRWIATQQGLPTHRGRCRSNSIRQSFVKEGL